MKAVSRTSVTINSIILYALLELSLPTNLSVTPHTHTHTHAHITPPPPPTTPALYLLAQARLKHMGGFLSFGLSAAEANGLQKSASILTSGLAKSSPVWGENASQLAASGLKDAAQIAASGLKDATQLAATGLKDATSMVVTPTLFGWSWLLVAAVVAATYCASAIKRGKPPS